MQAPTEKQQSEVLVERMMGELERRVAEWKASVQREREDVQRERQLLETEKAQLRQRTAVLSETAEEMANALGDIHKMRADLEQRLAVTPMDLTAQQLQSEWKRIDEEKALVKKSQEFVQTAIQRLQDAEAAFELVM